MPVAMKRLSLVLVAAMLAVACGATPLEDLADRTCEQLEEAAPSPRMEGLFNGAVLQADRLGATLEDLMAELFEECPVIMSDLTTITRVETGPGP